MQKFLNYDGLQSLVERIKSCYLLEIGVSGGAGAIMVDSTADRAEINAIVEGNAPMPIAVKLHMADNDTDYIVNTCQVRGGYFMLYIPDDMVLTDIDGTEFTGTWMTFMADSFTAAVDYYATSVDLRNSTQVITDTSKATSSNVLYLVADSSKNVTGVVYNSKTYTFAAEKGEKGDKGDTGATGVGITSVKQTVASMISGDTNVVEITTSDGKTSQVKIRNGNASTSGTEIVQTTGTATDKVMSQKAVTDDINSAISFARRQGVPQAKCFQFSKNYTFYSGSQLKDKTLIVGLYGAGEFLKGSIYYNNSAHELQIGNGERKRLTGRINTSEHAETLVVYFDDVGIAHAYMDGKLCYDFPNNTQPDTVTINVLESRKFKQILLLDGDLHQAANELLWAKGWQDWLINSRNMNTTREVIKIDNSTDLWMAAGWTAAGTASYKLYVVDYNITNNTEKEVKVSVNSNTIGYGGDIVIPAGQSASVRRLIDSSAQGALGYNGNHLPFSLTAKSVAVIKGIDYRYVYNGGFYDLAGLVPTDEQTIIPNPEEYLKVKSTNTYPDAVGQIGYDATGRLYMGAIDLTWKQINNT